LLARKTTLAFNIDYFPNLKATRENEFFRKVNNENSEIKSQPYSLNSSGGSYQGKAKSAQLYM